MSPGSPMKKARKAASRSVSLPISSCPIGISSAAPKSEIADITSNLTVVGGRIVYGAGDFKSLDDGAPAARDAGLVARPQFRRLWQLG